MTLAAFHLSGIYTSSTTPGVPPAIDNYNVNLFGTAVGVLVSDATAGDLAAGTFHVNGTGQETGNLALANGRGTLTLSRDITSAPGSGTCDVSWTRVLSGIVVDLACTITADGVSADICAILTGQVVSAGVPPADFRIVGNSVPHPTCVL